MSNLYKQRYIVTEQNHCRVINSNQGVAEKLEALAREVNGTNGFVQGLMAEQVEIAPPEPEISLEEVRKEADAIIETARQQAKQEAEQMIAEAEQQVESITANAKAEGEALGYQEGQRKAAEELEERRKRMEERKYALESEYQRKQESLEPQILEAVCEVFEKVFCIQFDQNKEILLHLVKNAILKIESTKEFQVRVSEKNYKYLEEHKNEILSQVGQNIKLDIEADASMDEKQCVMETDSGFFECSIDVQFENLIKAIRSLSV